MKAALDQRAGLARARAGDDEDIASRINGFLL
jgi:hypothetical protein